MKIFLSFGVFLKYDRASNLKGRVCSSPLSLNFDVRPTIFRAIFDFSKPGDHSFTYSFIYWLRFQKIATEITSKDKNKEKGKEPNLKAKISKPMAV